MSTINLYTSLETIHCYKCGIQFAFPEATVTRRRHDGESFFCPAGHSQCFTDSENTRLRKELEAKERELRATKCEVLNERALKDAERVERDRLDRKLRRVNRGVCPCCNRSFTNLARHMATKHPTK